jgi:PEP-CTERM motif-containing protein
MKKLKYWVLTAAMVLGAGNMTQSACALTVEDFETYADTAALNAAWPATVSSASGPVVTLSTGAGFFHSGAKAMQLDYDCSGNPPSVNENQLQFTFGSNQNWSGFSQFDLWVRSVDGATSNEKLSLQLKDEFGATLGSVSRRTQIGNTWTDWSVSLAGFTNLANVRKITIDVSADDIVNGFGKGTLYFDDMSVTAAIPEPSTFGLMLLSGVGLLVIMKRRNSR